MCDVGRGAHVATVEFSSKEVGDAVNADVQLDFAERSDGDSSCFGNNHGQAVGFLRDSETGSMARSQFGDEVGVGSERKEAGGSDDSTTLNNHGTVMQRSGGLEDGAEQIARNGGVEVRAAFGKSSETDFPLDND